MFCFGLGYFQAVFIQATGFGLYGVQVDLAGNMGHLDVDIGMTTVGEDRVYFAFGVGVE